MKYSVKTGQPNEKVLHINDNQSVCPFVNAIPISGKMGGFNLIRMPCSTLCPHAKADDLYYSISCSGSVEMFPLELTTETPEVDNDNKIIQM
mgnify:CR=1 FL=1